MKSANNTRLALGFFFLIMALVNLNFLLTNPGVYNTFTQNALLPIYDQWWHDIVMPNLTLFLWVLVLFEVLIGFLLLGHGLYVKVGLIGALFFTMLLMPANPFTLLNIIFVVLCAALLGYDYETSFFDMLTGDDVEYLEETS